MPATRKAVATAPMPVERQRRGSASPTYASVTAAKLAASRPWTARSTPTMVIDEASDRAAVAIANATIPGISTGLRPYRSDSGPKISRPSA